MIPDVTKPRRRRKGRCPIDTCPHSNLACTIYRSLDTPSVMVLGGKTLLWCENGIVFLRPPQTFAGVSPTPEGAGSLFRLRPRAPWYYPREITFLPVVATSSFHPYLETSPISCSTARGNGAPRKVNEEGSSSSSPSRSCPHSPRMPANEEKKRKRKRRRERERRQTERQRNRDEVVKSVERLKIIQGSALRADALAALTCPHLSAYYVPITSRYLADPEEHDSREDLRDEVYGIGSSTGKFRGAIAGVTWRGQNGIHHASRGYTLNISFHATTLLIHRVLR